MVNKTMQSTRERKREEEEESKEQEGGDARSDAVHEIGRGHGPEECERRQIGNRVITTHCAAPADIMLKPMRFSDMNDGDAKAGDETANRKSGQP